MKTLKKQSKKKILLRNSIKEFLQKKLWQYILVIAFVLFSAWLFRKPIEAVMFCISHIVIRVGFEKQYHYKHRNRARGIAICLFITLTIIFFGVASCLPVEISLLSTIPICFLICWVGYIVQDRIDIMMENKQLQEEFDIVLEKLKQEKNIDVYSMTEDELRNFAKSKGLKEHIVDTLRKQL